MKEFWEYSKTRQGSFRLGGDLLMLAGVAYLHWSPLRIISLFWLDTIIMGIFLSYFITRQFKAHFLFMLPCIFLFSSLMLGLYTEIARSFHTGHVIFLSFDTYLAPFQPLYETSGILISIVLGHFFESRYFVLLIKKDSQLSLNYIFVFFARFMIINGVMFTVEVMKSFFDSDIKIIVPMIALIVLKQYVEYRLYKIYNRKLLPEPREEKIPMI